MTTLDDIDRRILRALDENPRATVQLLAQQLGYARGTVQSRVEKLFRQGRLRPNSTTVFPRDLGYPVRAFVTAEANQDELSTMMTDIARVPEVVECLAISGSEDLMLQVVARDAEHLYDITQRLMLCHGIRRTSTSLVLRELMAHRMDQLIGD
ncbi:Lrp/AsnC family transcriptional regulator [Leucobacter sp. M11]|nr:Lrp/AsnC family transcriptional regulator [Leucobacter sp. M11]